MLENPHDSKENGTSSQVGTKLRSDEKVGEAYSLSRNTIARYLRVEKLISPLRSRLDDGSIPFVPAVTISFLRESEQTLVAECMKRNGLAVDMKKADMLRQASEKNRLDGDTIYHILSGKATQKPNRTPTVKVNKEVYAKYFKPGQSAKEVQEIVEKALEMFFGKN